MAILPASVESASQAGQGSLQRVTLPVYRIYVSQVTDTESSKRAKHNAVNGHKSRQVYLVILTRSQNSNVILYLNLTK
jgi:hypothetical protein